MLRGIAQTIKAAGLLLRHWRDFLGAEEWQRRAVLGELLPWRTEIDRWEIRVRPKGARGWMTYETVKERYGCTPTAISGFNRMRPSRREHIVQKANERTDTYPRGTYQCREILEGEKLGKAVWRYVHIGGFDPTESRRGRRT